MKKRIFSLLLSVLTVLTVIPQTMIFSSAAKPDSGSCGDKIVDIYMNNKNVWMGSVDYLPMNGRFYTFLDIDFDGTSELIVSNNDGSSKTSENNFYKISSDGTYVYLMKNTEDITYDFGLTENMPELLKNKQTGKLYYLVQDNIIISSGWESYYGIISFENGKTENETVFSKSYYPVWLNPENAGNNFYFYDNGEMTKTDEDTYNKKFEAFMSENESTGISPLSICSNPAERFEIMDEETQRSKLKAAYDSSVTDGVINNPDKNIQINSFNIPGDADGDGSVTAADARLILRASLGLESDTEELTKIADLDSDGRITDADAQLILRKSVGLTENSEELLDAADSEIAQAGKDLYSTLFWNNYNDTAVDFDCRNMTYKELLDNWFMHISGFSYVYYYYFGKTDIYCSLDADDPLSYHQENDFENINRVPQADPLNKFYVRDNSTYDFYTSFYYKYSKEKIDWIFKNILNLSDEEINNIENNNYEKIISGEYTAPYTESYMYDGYLYSRMITGFGENPLPSEPFLIDYNRLNDGKYEFRFKEVLSDGYEDILGPDSSPEDYEFYLTAVMGLKEIDGGRYWSVYSVKTYKN